MKQQGGSKTPWVLGAVVVVAVATVIAYVVNMDHNPADQTVQDTPSAPKPSDTSKESQLSEDKVERKEGVVILFTDEGFSPKEYTVRANQKVTVKNDSSVQLQFSSDDHPTHTEQPELNLPVLQPGEEASFTPTRVGNWGFHDHINDQYTGSLTVTE